MAKFTVTRILFKGIVQGVGFRPTIFRVATAMQSKGYVLNKGSEVEVVIDVDPTQFIEHVKKQLPTLASISSIETESIKKQLSHFQIIQSTQGSHESLIPVDTAICPDCLHELLSKKDKRYQYPFINCTVCGARYSLIANVPYDRKHTAMDSFPLCKTCTNEYQDASNRRFHAQTISCPVCGPSYTLYNKKKRKNSTNDPIKAFSKKINQGSIGVMKSWGGMHLCCNLDEIKRFREWYKRPQKAFAVMVRSLEVAEEYATLTDFEKNILTSSTRPIVLVKKHDHEFVSPGLDSIGLFLPYTAVHHLFFKHLERNAVIMTSANIPGEPMIINNNDAFKLNADFYLLHNRDILNRVDDTVVKPWNDQLFFLRKSRGYVPDPITVDYDDQIISVGAGQNVYGAISAHSKLFLTPYLGNDSSIETLEFLKKTLHHYLDLLVDTNLVAAVTIDKHPHYQTRRIGSYFAELFHIPLIDVQHHWAHAVSLLVDNKVDNGVVLTLDGLGYGDDGTMWGGEILYTDFFHYERIGHLEPIRLLGGDKATKDPRRLVYAIFKMFDEDMYFTNEESLIFEKMIHSATLSSSMGRILDALSCYLEICCKRTYDGEPAMKLERYLLRGSDVYDFDISISHGILDTIDLFSQLHEKTMHPLTEKKRADLSYSFVHCLIDGMIQVAIQAAEMKGTNHIGLTGGVSYNLPITNMVVDIIKSKGYHPLVHHHIPNGDGGIAIGQNVITAHQVSSTKHS